VFGMSELTDWERHRLAALERHLADESPELAELLAGRRHRARRWPGAALIGWAMGVIGAVLLLCGSALQDTSVGMSGFVLLGLCWVPSWRARDAARHPHP
jgi:hypothetical protein